MLDFLSDKPSRKTTRYLLISSFVLFIVMASVVIWLLQLSNYGGELNQTQLGFSAQYIKSNFSPMTAEDMSLFVTANLFDYVFMIAYGSFIFTAALTLARKLPNSSVWKKIGFVIAIFGVAAAVCDGMENIFLLSMAANPLNFPHWLAIPHSSFALIKFVFMYTAFAGLALLAIVRVAKRKQLS